MQPGYSSIGGPRTKVRCYSVYGKLSYNTRTCQMAVEASDSAVSNVIVVSSQYCCIAIRDNSWGVGKSIRPTDKVR